MTNPTCPVPVHPPVVVFASHEELLRSARDMWAVAVSLLTELTPDKFTTAPWAAGLFTVELPFILAKLWHLQQGLLATAHSYMQTESMLTTFLESIDITKLFGQLTQWNIDLHQGQQPPRGISQHVPETNIMQPSDVNIIKARFEENTWSGKPLIRHESFQMHDGNSQHWFYLPKGHEWNVINGLVSLDQPDPRLTDFIKQKTLSADQIYLVAEKDGEVFIPDVTSQNLEGKVSVFRFSD